MGRKNKRKLGLELRKLGLETDPEATDVAISARLIGVSSTTQRHKRSKLERFNADRKRFQTEQEKQLANLKKLRAPVKLKSKAKKYLHDILSGTTSSKRQSEEEDTNSISKSELLKLRKRPKLKKQKKNEERSAFTEKDFKKFIRGFNIPD